MAIRHDEKNVHFYLTHALTLFHTIETLARTMEAGHIGNHLHAIELLAAIGGEYLTEAEVQYDPSPSSPVNCRNRES